jgi:hypothetical protein
MAGWGRCRQCQEQIWWGASPYTPGRPFPYDDDEEEQPHFESCQATEWVTDVDGQRYRVSNCKACNAKVWWETTVRGKRRPMDVDGDRAGGECHFETCPGQVRGAPRAEPQHSKKKAHASVAQAPYEVRLWLPDLGLRWPCTVDEVTRSFRRLALIHHPDMGGNASDFIRIKLAYDRLKQLLGVEVPV